MKKEIADGLYFEGGFVVLTWGGYKYDIARERIDTPEKLLFLGMSFSPEILDGSSQDTFIYHGDYEEKRMET